LQGHTCVQQQQQQQQQQTQKQKRKQIDFNHVSCSCCSSRQCAQGYGLLGPARCSVHVAVLKHSSATHLRRYTRDLVEHICNCCFYVSKQLIRVTG
jgi:hypothetical protein